MNNYINLVLKQTPEIMAEKVAILQENALNPQNDLFGRYASTKGLSDLKSGVNDLRSNKNNNSFNELYGKISEIITEIKNKEQNQQLKEAYMFLN